jgi:hypothetical protein
MFMQQWGNCWKRCFLCGPCRGSVTRTSCHGDSKIWSRVPRDFDPRKTALARASSIYKLQTRFLVREGAPQKQDRNCQTAINIWLWAPDGARHQDLRTDWPSVAMWLWLWLWLRESLQRAVGSVGGWCEMAISLRGREPESRGTFIVGRRYTVKTVSKDASLSVIVICKV